MDFFHSLSLTRQLSSEGEYFYLQICPQGNFCRVRILLWELFLWRSILIGGVMYKKMAYFTHRGIIPINFQQRSLFADISRNVRYNYV